MILELVSVLLSELLSESVSEIISEVVSEVEAKLSTISLFSVPSFFELLSEILELDLDFASIVVVS